MVSQKELARKPEFQSNLWTNLPKSQCFHLPLSLKELTFYITSYLSAVSKTKQSKHNKTQHILPNIIIKNIKLLGSPWKKKQTIALLVISQKRVPRISASGIYTSYSPKTMLKHEI